MSGKLSLTDGLSVLGNRQYRNYTIGTFASNIGDWAQKLAVGWLAWQLTESPAWLGIILFCDTAPTLVFSLVGGAVTDRMDRLKLSKITALLSLLQPLLLVTLYFTGQLNIWILAAATVYLGAANAFGQTAKLAVMALLVPERDLPRAAPISSMTFNLARFAGPAIFGIVTAVSSPAWAMMLNVFSYLLFFVILSRLRTRKEALARRRKGATLLGDIGEGMRYGFTHPGIGPLLIMLVVGSLGTRAFIDLLPGFASGVFGRGPEALSMMTSAVGLGALTGATYLTMRQGIVGLARLAMYATAWVGAMLAIFASMQVFWLAVVMLYFAGIGLSLSAVSVMTIVQTTVKGELRGRVLSIYGIIFRGGPAVGGLIMGWIAEWTGLGWPVAGGGMLCVAVWLWGLGRLKQVRQAVERPLQDSAAAEPEPATEGQRG